MIEWLMAPIDVAREHHVSLSVSWHGRLMVLAWCFLLPIGILAARFFKVLPWQDWPRQLDNKTWWYAHNVLQYGGVTLALVAAVWVERTQGSAAWFHSLFGWSVVALMLVQVVGGLLRGSKGGPTEPADDGSLVGDHYSMTRRRKIFERAHKTLGYLAVLLAFVALATGLWQANAPRWMAVVIALWWLLLIVVGGVLQRRGRAIDTYQAIWGPNPKHPGNAMPPFGWGVRRLAPKRDEHPD
jgi:hypothetical protein